jgi:hypothetical protein
MPQAVRRADAFTALLAPEDMPRMLLLAARHHAVAATAP